MEDTNVPFAKTDAGKRSAAFHMAKDYFYLVGEKPSQKKFLDFVHQIYNYVTQNE